MTEEPTSSDGQHRLLDTWRKEVAAQKAAGKQLNKEEGLVAQYLLIIKRLAENFSKKAADSMDLMDDLISCGMAGLIEAARKFDDRKGATLDTFVYLRIRGAMIDELRRIDWFPRSARAKAKKIRSTIDALAGKLVRQPEAEEVARELGIDMEQYFALLQEAKDLSVISIEDLSEISETGREVLIHAMMGKEISMEEMLYAKELQEVVLKKVRRLPKRERQVINLLYYKDTAMKEVAEKMNVSSSRVTQLRDRGVNRLKRRLLPMGVWQHHPVS